MAFILPFVNERLRRPGAGVLLRVALLAVLAGFFGASAARAQQSGSGATDPAKIEQRIERPGRPREAIEDFAVPAPTPRVAPAERFTLTGVEIVGATVYDPAEFGPIYEPYLGRAISLPEVELIAKGITERYRRDGYFLTRALAPPQEVGFGILRIEVVEGFVERAIIKGEVPGRRALFDRWIAKITEEQPLRIGTLERYLLLMADLPGITVRPTLNPVSEETGGYVLELVLEHRTVEPFFSLDNRGTTSVGPIQSYVGANLNSPFRLFERTRIAAFTIPGEPEELRYGELFQEHILTAEGTRVWGLASRSIVDVGEAGSTDKENAYGTRVTLGLTQPVLRSRDQNLNLTLKADAIDSDKRSPSQVFDDKLRVVRFGADYNVKDGIGGTTWIVAEVSRGLDVLHATDSDSTLVSRTNGRAKFVKYTLDIVRQQPLFDRWAVQVGAAGQLSPHTLLSPEEFAVGGRRFGRAYDPADISGSNGAAGYIELQYNPTLKLPLFTEWQLYGFWDLGAVWGQGFNRLSMASAGGGIRFGLPLNMTGGIEIAAPLTRALMPGEADRDEARAFFSLLGRF